MEITLRVLASGGMGAPAGDPEQVIELAEGSVLQDLLDRFLQTCGTDSIGGSQDYQRRYLFRYVSVSVNSEVVPNDKAKHFPLHEGDRVMIVPFIAGGCGNPLF